MNPKDILTKQFLYEEFIVKRKGIYTIAKENGIKSKNSITQYLEKYGLSRNPIRNSAEILTKDFLVEHYVNNNRSLKEITKLIGIKNRHSVKLALENYNIPIRKHTRSESYLDSMKQRRLYEEISHRYWYSIIESAKTRGLDFTISPEYVWNLFLQQDSCCAISGIKIVFADCCNDQTTQTASLDRIDSSKGYIEGNVQWTHKIVNKMKMNLPQEEFIEWCKQISNHNQ